MAKSRKTKRVARKVTRTKKVHRPKVQHKDEEPSFMVQVAEPKMLRKDILESLREVIIFMQGYEKFMSIQEEKVSLFSSLQTEVKDLRFLINDKLRKLLPKGKLPAVNLTRKREMEEVERKSLSQNEVEVVNIRAEPESKPKDDLFELESQLKDIESQLQSIK
jgi:hypothetical protein